MTDSLDSYQGKKTLRDNNTSTNTDTHLHICHQYGGSFCCTVASQQVGSWFKSFLQETWLLLPPKHARIMLPSLCP